MLGKIMSLDFGLIFNSMKDLPPSVVMYWNSIARSLLQWEKMMGLMKAEILHSESHKFSTFLHLSCSLNYIVSLSLLKKSRGKKCDLAPALGIMAVYHSPTPTQGSYPCLKLSYMGLWVKSDLCCVFPHWKYLLELAAAFLYSKSLSTLLYTGRRIAL